jgi:hypothetical protein
MSNDQLTVVQTAAVLRKAGWPETLIPTMVAIARAESGLRVGVTSPPNTNGTIDRGLLQINSSHAAYDPAKLISDPVYNARAGLDIFHAQGLNAWSTWKFRKVSPKQVNAISTELGDNLHTGSGGVGGVVNGVIDGAGGAVGAIGGAAGAAAGAVGGAAKDTAGAVGGIVGGALSGLAGEVLKVGLMLVLVAAGAGLVVLGVNAAASSSKSVRNAKADAASLAPLALA